MRLLSTTLLFVFFVTDALATTIVVGKNQAVRSLKKAIELCHNGDTIQLLSGIYKEGNITIQKAITIIGIDDPVLDGEFKYENLTIGGNDIHISGLVLKNSRESSSNDYAAISITDGTNITIENNKIINAHFAIHVNNSTYCTIRNNDIQGQAKSEQSAGNGIHLWKCSHILVEKNHIRGHRDGIYFEFVTYSDIKENISEKNIRYGLHFMFSNHDNYIRNTFSSNGTGVAVMYSNHVNMEFNVFEKNWGAASYAILLKEISDSRIVSNKFLTNTVGLFLEGTSRIAIHKNLFKENGWAVKVQASCTDNNFYQNNFLQNTFDVSTNGSLVLNTFNNNYWDKYDGYDINKDGVGDIPYHPVSMYSMVVEQNPNALILLKSFMVSLLDKAEKAIPSLTPENLIDNKPMMKPNQL
ncbi:MAG TPA: nitrous oxide reductase family maturation protein NosD [Chitinophagaceae bacterium]|jgi:nitrous oxidase accessory protein|nr:nitrous oxide reductase family maturation protein NosD [Chitinophagaceae bacterium]